MFFPIKIQFSEAFSIFTTFLSGRCCLPAEGSSRQASLAAIFLHSCFECWQSMKYRRDLGSWQKTQGRLPGTGHQQMPSLTLLRRCDCRQEGGFCCHRGTLCVDALKALPKELELGHENWSSRLGLRLPRTSTGVGACL